MLISQRWYFLHRLDFLHTIWSDEHHSKSAAHSIPITPATRLHDHVILFILNVSYQAQYSKLAKVYVIEIVINSWLNQEDEADEALHNIIAF